MTSSYIPINLFHFIIYYSSSCFIRVVICHNTIQTDPPYIILRATISYHIITYHTPYYLALWYHPTLHHYLSPFTLPCPMISFFITSSLIILHVTLPYDIIPYYIISYHPSYYLTLIHPTLHYHLSPFTLPYLMILSYIASSLIILHISLPYDQYHPSRYLTLLLSSSCHPSRKVR